MGLFISCAWMNTPGNSSVSPLRTPRDYGLIEQAGPTGVVTPKMSKGYWLEGEIDLRSELYRQPQSADLSDNVAGEIGRVRLKGQEHSVQLSEQLPRK